MAIKEFFHRYSVIKAIEDLEKSIPTPTDEQHQAQWWNEGFGLVIRSHYTMSLRQLKERIKKMEEPR